MTRGCTRLARVALADDELHVSFDGPLGPRTCSFEVSPHTAHALHHLCVLQGHGEDCDGTIDVQASLLIKALGAVDAAATAIVVRTGAHPAFWLRLGTSQMWTELDLDLLEAVGLLLAGRLPIHLLHDDGRAWDMALERLVDESR